MSKCVYIIIVMYNAVEWLDYCLAPFDGALPSGWRVIVVDNASGDGTASAVKERFPWAVLIQSETNLGFGRANNIAMRKALADNADYVFLLNQDARISTNGIERLVDIQSRHPESLITSPIHLAGNEKELDLSFSKYCAPVECPGLLHDALRGRLSEIYFSDRGNAAAWLLSRECLERVGGFNPSFYHYGEDDDYVNRVLHQGGKLGVAPSVFAAHNRIQKVSTRPPDYKCIRALVKYLNPAPSGRRPGKLVMARFFIPMLLRNILRRRYAIAAHYAKVMLSVLKESGKPRADKRQRAPYLR